MHVLFGHEEPLEPTLNDYLWGELPIHQAAHDVTDRVARLAPVEPGGALYLVPSSMKAGDIARVLREGYDVGTLNEGFRDLARELSLDYLIIDTHPGLNEETLLSITISDILLLILRPDRQDFQGTAVTVHVARRLDVSSLLLVLNKVPGNIDLDDLREQMTENYDAETVAIMPLAALDVESTTIGLVTAVIVLLLLVVIALMAAIYSAQVVAPLRSVIEGFSRFQNGSPPAADAHLPVRGQGEIAELVRWFNLFLDSIASLQASRVELMQQQSALNQRVAELEQMLDLAGELDRNASSLSLRDRFVYAQAPVDARTESLLQDFLGWAWEHAQKGSVSRPGVLDEVDEHSRLDRMEQALRTCTLWLWLDLRFPGIYGQVDEVVGLRSRLNDGIERQLKGKKPLWQMRQRGRARR